MKKFENIENNMSEQQQTPDTNEVKNAAVNPENTVPTPAPSSKLISAGKRTLILMFIVLLIGIALILWAWKLGPFHSNIQSTENSYVKGKTTVLSSQINGYVKDVLVTDFDHVKKVPVVHIDQIR